MSEICNLKAVLSRFYQVICTESDDGRSWEVHIPLHLCDPECIPWLAISISRCQVEDDVDYEVRCLAEKSSRTLQHYNSTMLGAALLRACVDLYVRGSFDLDGCGNWALLCADAVGHILEELAEKNLKSGEI